jgi:hypothetical protein
MLRVAFKLGKETGNVCLRRNRRPPQALPSGGHRPGWQGARQPQREQRRASDPVGDRRPAARYAAAFEAAFGWGWLAGLLEDYGFEAHLVHPLQCKAIASARLKNDPLTELPVVSAAQQA